MCNFFIQCLLYSEVKDNNAQVKGRVPFIDSGKTIQEQRTAQKTWHQTDS